MKYSEFEKHISAKLNGNRESVDMDNLLNALDLKEERKIKPLYYLLILPFLIIGALGWYSLSSGDVIAPEKPALSQSLDLDSDIQNDEPTSPITTLNYTNTNNQNTENQPKNNLLENASNNEENTTQQTHLDGSKTQTKTTVNQKYLSENKSNNKTLKQSINTTENKQDTYTIDRTNEISLDLQADAPQAELNDIERVTSNRNSSNDIGEAVVLDVANIEMRNLLEIDQLENQLASDAFSRMKINCPSFNKAHWRIALIPEVGIYAPQKTLTPKFTDQSAAFITRQNNESTLEGIEVGLHAMLVRDRLPFYMKLGTSYSRIAERTDLDYEFVERDTMVGIISSTVSMNGDTVTHIYGDIVTETTFTGKETRHSFIHTIDLPISAGYTTYVGGFDIGVEAGVRINLMTRGTGNQLVTDTEFANLSFEPLVKRRIGLSYFGGLLIGRSIGGIGDFYLAPRFIYNPNDFASLQNQISQNYFSVGLNIGYVHMIK